MIHTKVTNSWIWNLGAIKHTTKICDSYEEMASELCSMIELSSKVALPNHGKHDNIYWCSVVEKDE